MKRDFYLNLFFDSLSGISSRDEESIYWHCVYYKDNCFEILATFYSKIDAEFFRDKMENDKNNPSYKVVSSVGFHKRKFNKMRLKEIEELLDKIGDV